MEKNPCVHKGLLCAQACAFCLVRRLVRGLCAQALCAGFVRFVRVRVWLCAQSLCEGFVRGFVRTVSAQSFDYFFR